MTETLKSDGGEVTALLRRAASGDDVAPVGSVEALGTRYLEPPYSVIIMDS